MEILITDVTEMHGDIFCVAGWDSTNKRMIRPLPDGGHWPQALIAKYGIQPGTILKAQPKGTSNSAYPHSMEDTPIDPATIATSQTSPDWTGSAAPAISPTIALGFNNSLQWNKIYRGVHQGVYVPKGTQCNSLIAVKVGKSDVSFVEPFGKLLTHRQRRHRELPALGI